MLTKNDLNMANNSFRKDIFFCYAYFFNIFVPQATYGGQIYAPLCNWGTFHYKIYLNHR